MSLKDNEEYKQFCVGCKNFNVIEDYHVQCKASKFLSGCKETGSSFIPKQTVLETVQLELKRQYDRIDKLLPELETLRSENITLNQMNKTQKSNIESYQREVNTLKSENTILRERVKELDNIDEHNKKQIELKGLRIKELEERLHEAFRNNNAIGNTNYFLLSKIEELKKELTALKNSKTVFVRRK